MKCLPDEVYNKLAEREMQHFHYAEKLETIIKSTWLDDNDRD